MLPTEILLEDCGRAEREKTDHGAQPQALRGSIGKTQYIIEEAVLLVPHAVMIRTDVIQGCRNGKEVADKLENHFVNRLHRPL